MQTRLNDHLRGEKVREKTMISVTSNGGNADTSLSARNNSDEGLCLDECEEETASQES